MKIFFQTRLNLCYEMVAADLIETRLWSSEERSNHCLLIQDMEQISEDTVCTRTSTDPTPMMQGPRQTNSTSNDFQWII